MTAEEKDAILHDETGLRVERVSGRSAFEGNLLHLFCDEVALPNGDRAVWEIVRHRGAVCVVPVAENGDVLLVRQFRYPIGKVLLEIPAGKLEEGDEDRAAAALRELKEETGVCAASLVSLGDFYGAPAYSDERLTLYLATGLTEGEQKLDRDEFLRVVRIPLAEAVRLVLDGEIEDMKTQAGLLRAYLTLQNRTESL
ncbi:MAG: NUDIX hydrolase [Clostridia bacterium]|nr:NUDIX hydrolase [Clostridia bacterium]